MGKDPGADRQLATASSKANTARDNTHGSGPARLAGPGPEN